MVGLQIYYLGNTITMPIIPSIPRFSEQVGYTGNNEDEEWETQYPIDSLHEEHSRLIFFQKISKNYLVLPDLLLPICYGESQERTQTATKHYDIVDHKLF